MRISDWSSDVCSSDLSPVPRFIRFGSDGNAMPGAFHPKWIQVSLETGQFCPFKHYRRGCLGWSAAMIVTEMEVNSVGRYGDAPSVLVASDNISGGRIIESALAAIDARIVDSLPLAGLEDRLDRMVSISAVIVHADIGTPAHQDRKSTRLNSSH